MAWSGQKIKVYAKMIGILLLLLIVLLFILLNREPISVRFLWMTTPEIPLYLLLLITAIIGSITVAVLKRVRKVFGEFKSMLREEKKRQSLVDEIRAKEGGASEKAQADAKKADAAPDKTG